MSGKYFTTKLLFVLVTIFCMVSPEVNGKAELWVWIKVASPTETYFQSIDMISSTEGWAVGNEGAIMRWDGTNWKIVTSPTASVLKSVDIVSSTDGGIVGADGLYR